MTAEDGRQWQRGEVVLVQEIWRGRVWSAHPMRVVDDATTALVLWVPTGTPRMLPAAPEGRPRARTRPERLARLMEAGDWTHRASAWNLASLWFMVPGAQHHTRVSWLPNGRFLGWYVNLEVPFVRTDRGIQHMDLALDVLVDRNRVWRWKDEDELAYFVTRGLIAHEVAEAIREEGLKAVDRLARREPPFDEQSTRWVPDPSRLLPQLPEDWAQP